jgi:hypothetical protein
MFVCAPAFAYALFLRALPGVLPASHVSVVDHDYFSDTFSEIREYIEIYEIIVGMRKRERQLSMSE